MTKIYRTLVLVGILLVLVPVISQAATVEITMGDFFYQPETVSINPGDTVTWINQGSMNHTSSSGLNCTPDGLWDSGTLAPGQSYSLTFNEPGSFPYLCDIGFHCELYNMVGTVVVASDVVVEDPIPVPIRKGLIAVRLETLTTGLTAPNFGTVAQGVADRLFVSDQTGIVWAIDLSSGAKSVFLDVRSRLVALGIGGEGSYDERGLLGVAFHPEYATNGLLYLYTSEPVKGAADFSTMPQGTAANHQSVITEWHNPNPGDSAAVVDPSSARELLRIDQPQFNHNGGALNFGPDGLLYISLGDGGGADDEDGPMFIDAPIVGHGEGNGQNPDNVLGTILRINPGGTGAANGKYGIPADNPFVGQVGYRSEIFAFGFRNPFRFSFDRLTGMLYAGDVGQNNIEEVNLVQAGGNYGWNAKEGSFCFDPNGSDPGMVSVCAPEPIGLTDPIAQYDHDEGIAVIGGFVYRGTALAHLGGKYVFGDLSRTGGDGRLFYLARNGAIRELRMPGRQSLGLWLMGFGQDSAGELYVLGNTSGIPFGETGVVLKIVPAH